MEEDDFTEFEPWEWVDTPEGWNDTKIEVNAPPVFREEDTDKMAFISFYDPDNRLGFGGMKARILGTEPESRHPNSARFHEILEQLGELHDRKQADYGKGDDPFANVRSSEEWGVEGWKGAMIRLNDKVKRLQNYARNGTLKNEGVVDSFMDIAVYAVIAQVLWEQEQG